MTSEREPRDPAIDSGSAQEAPAADYPGLTSAEAAARLAKDGPNSVELSTRRTTLAILVAQLTSPLVVILIAAAAISFSIGDRVEAAVILAMVGLSAALGFVQEARSEAAIHALAARVALRSTAIRDGTPHEILAHDLVVGDLLVLDAGDILPADARLIEANHLFLDESALTGESEPAAKEARPGRADPTNDADRSGFVYFGTNVVSGEGRCVITATGRHSAFGTIVKRLAERAPETDFQRGVRQFGMLITRTIFILVVATLAMNVALGRPLLESLLFAIALAVGLTPELLPAIVTLNLTRGARSLANDGVIVKRLPAIQNLGSMTILCTDKTGTLTVGKLSLERSLTLDGARAPEAERLGWLNSHFQAGFTNPLDTALLAAMPEPPGLASTTKLAELPFDFSRRCLSVLVRAGDSAPVLATKGAPESILTRSTRLRLPAPGGSQSTALGTSDIAGDSGDVERSGARGVIAIDEAHREQLRRLVDEAAAEGYHAVAVGSRVVEGAERAPGSAVPAIDALESELVFEGLLLFSDPPKEGVGEVIARLREQGVSLKVLTGDHELVARHVASAVGLPIEGTLSGDEMRKLSPAALVARAQKTTIFSRVDPDQKLQVLRALRERGAVVGYVGDGINDAPSLHVADVGISVDNATDVARGAADIILLQPSLAAISRGVAEGRRTFANTLKYIRMGTSSNFGNMLSMAGATLIVPFLPMLPGQILVNNFIYDLSQTVIPSDRIDEEVEAEPARWDVHEIQRFMLVFGPISSIFDFATFGILLLVFNADPAAFHTGWFVESLATQVLVIFIIRTRRPFWRSRPSRALALTAFAAVAVAALIPMTPIGDTLGFVDPPLLFWPLIGGIVAAYLVLVEIVKRFVMRRRAPGAAGGTAESSGRGRIAA